MRRKAVKHAAISAIVAAVLLAGLASQAHANQMDALLLPGNAGSKAHLTVFRNIELYYPQGSSLAQLLDGKNVILNTPTGSGKSLVASAMLFASLARGQRAVYTCPIKALVNEKWMALCREFGPDQVGLSTGDASVNVLIR